MWLYCFILVVVCIKGADLGWSLIMKTLDMHGTEYMVRRTSSSLRLLCRTYQVCYSFIYE